MKRILLLLLFTTLFLQARSQEMKPVLERTWKGGAIVHMGLFTGRSINAELTISSYNERTQRFTAILVLKGSGRNKLYTSVCKYVGQFNPPRRLVFELDRVISEDTLPSEYFTWDHPKFIGANISGDSDHPGNYILVEDTNRWKLMLATYSY